MERLEGEPLRWLSHDYRVRRNGVELTLIDLTFRSRGEFVLEGERYEFRREHLLARSYILEQDGRVVARAERTGIIPSRYRVTVSDRQLTLRPRLPGHTWLVQHGDRTIGEVRRRRLFSRAFIAEFREPFPLVAEVFVLAVVVVRWRARARAR